MILKTPLAAVLLSTLALLCIPAVIGGDGGGSSSAGCGNIAVILDTIRTIESNGNYDAPKNAGGASGAYQYVDSTWNNYKGYQSAYLAPPEIQDARATTDVQAILGAFKDVAYVPVVWYWPAAAKDPSQLDIVPMPGAGNRLTVREYQKHWLAVYATKTAGATSVGCAGEAPTEGGYALPIDRALMDANPKMLDQPHHDYPAIDLLIPEGSPVYAVRGGTVTRTVDWPYNCYTVGRCDETCGIGISINGDDGAHYIYCHASKLNNINDGDTVKTGQLIMWSGNTGHSGTPHLHFEIRINGQQRCPQALLSSIYKLGAAVAPTVLVSSGCSF